MKSVYFTTPIYYVNAEPHMGHLYTTALGDMLKRYYQMTGSSVYYQTGTDEHGEKIVESSKKLNISPKEFCDKISDKFRSTWDEININYDDFIRTTDVRHKLFVQSILKKVYEKGDIYFDEYTGKYCVGCERYLTDTELIDGKCPDHQTVPKEIKEANYFFKMSKYQDSLIKHIEDNPEWIRPVRFKNEVLSFLKQPLSDLCISRPKSRLEWGIELPFDDKFVTYVWFDALLNYVSGIKETSKGDNIFDEFWQGCNHLIAKDILKTHAIYWPTMLMSAEIPLFNQLDVHGYWMMGESKMSKSLGNVIRPSTFDKHFGIENLRYFLFKEMKFGSDSSFNYDLFIERYNSDLANGLGNLLSRNAGLVAKNFNTIPAKVALTCDEETILKIHSRIVGDYKENFETRQFSKAIEDVMTLISATDKYITLMEPWKLAKDPGKKDQLARVLRCGLEVVRVSAVLLSPVMPQKAGAILDYLGETRPLDGTVSFEELTAFDSLKEGVELPKPPQFFPRFDSVRVEKILEEMEQETKTVSTETDSPETRVIEPIKDEITIDDFLKVQFKVGEIIEAHHVEGAQKLLRLMVDLGEENPRQIFAGIKSHYMDPKILLGEKVMVAANLKPRQMKFGLSEGMILAASGDDRLAVATFKGSAKPGDKVS
ncbi:MAG: methionine--tRNA ligase [Deltaproteobacteria bacterium]|nr:methionine--tRNA ligase [Deltaproteobacteria bacterium]